MTMTDDYFGTCPDCGDHDGYLSVGSGHWFYCRTHRTRWFIGSNLFSAWRDETEAEQRARFDELDFGSYATLEAW